MSENELSHEMLKIKMIMDMSPPVCDLFSSNDYDGIFLPAYLLEV
jgi:hypothetical protein